MFKGLFFRFLLIIIIPILILQFVGLYIFYERHWDSISKRLESNLVGEVRAIYSQIEARDFKDASRVARLLSFQLSEITESKSDIYFNAKASDEYLKNLSTQITAAILKPVFIEYYKDKNYIAIKIFHDASTVYAMQCSHKKVYSPTVTVFFAWMVGAAIIMILISVVFMKNQIRAILQLADAAEKFGKGQDIDKFKPTGAIEVRSAGRAFLKMKARIERQIYYRTQLLAHISHDLRTPLTRMGLSTQFIENKEVCDDINTEIQLMQNIIDDYLNFAKEEGNESTKSFDLVAAIKNLVRVYNNQKINFVSKTESCMVTLKPHALDRAFNNLVDNALKFCKEKVQITFSLEQDYWYLNIDDDGKGIPKDYYKKVFKPFYKLDKNSRGFGLGLAAVKSIIYSQGGKIKLAKSDLGGLRVIVKVPL